MQWSITATTTALQLSLVTIMKLILSIFFSRCNIPVVIMGETGCGKTRLIRYMCDLAAQGGNKRTGSQDGKNIKNMLIMKVRKLTCNIIPKGFTYFKFTLNTKLLIDWLLQLQLRITCI